jgi:hypothetical protein
MLFKYIFFFSTENFNDILIRGKIYRAGIDYIRKLFTYRTRGYCGSRGKMEKGISDRVTIRRSR